MQDHQQCAGDWFRDLRDRICKEFEALEDEVTGAYADLAPGRFARKPWVREGGGGGEMSVIRGRVFEKAGVNISTVHGVLPDALKKDMKQAEGFSHFWASGISLVAHPRSPRVPAVHMNTRMLVVGDRWLVKDEESSTPPSTIHHSPSTKHWFGGGADLTPVRPDDKDTEDFHAAFKACCDRFAPDYYPRFSKACDEYFYLTHRAEPRGVGGIFYDYLNTGNWEADIAFTQAVGETFLAIYPKLARRHMSEAWTPEERDLQLVRRGRYVEFNLLYDRGTRFGLLTGGNPEAILMSLPPEVKWP